MYATTKECQTSMSIPWPCRLLLKVYQEFSQITNPLQLFIMSWCKIKLNARSPGGIHQPEGCSDTSTSTILSRHSKLYIVDTDASDDTCGAQLSQEHNNYQPCVFHTFTDIQQKCITPKQEAYGDYYTITNLNYYLQGSDIIIFNDHKPLQKFFNGKNATQ